MTFGQRLRSARKSKGLTQKELAGIIDVKHNSVSNWENDQNKPDLDAVKRICSTLGIGPNYLFEGVAVPDVAAMGPDRAASKTEIAIFEAIHQLDEMEKQDVLEFIQFKVEQKEKRKDTLPGLK